MEQTKNMTNSHLHDLLSRYLSKTIRQDEWEELKRLVPATDDATLLSLLEQLWDEFDYRRGSLPDKRELDAIRNRIQKATGVRNVKSIVYRVLKVAAMLLIPLLLSISVYLYQDREQMNDLGMNEVVVHVAKGQKAMVTLPDGSTAYLNSESALRYRQNYGYENRNVHLEGEAFFEVKKDSTKKFTVNTEYLNVDVLGTSFNVYAYETENRIEMALVSGTVKVETHTTPAKTVYAKPNDKVVYNKTTGELQLKKTNTRFDTAWTRGELIFRSEPFHSVVSKIEHRFGVKIHVEGNDLDDDRFTGYFDSDRITDILENLKIHYKFNYKTKGDDIWIYTAN
jgi:ferric-dicitrate binding protein FerR (iron transport regulator)